MCGVHAQQSMAAAPAWRSGPGLDLSGEQWLIAGAVVGQPAAASNEAGKWRARIRPGCTQEPQNSERTE